MSQHPKTIDKYQIERVLGEGAMGLVYRALDPKIGRIVAIKTIHKHLLEDKIGEELRSRFAHEVRAVGKLTHPNIVAIYETDEYYESENESTPIPYFVMEFVAGKELEFFLKDDTRFPLEKVLDIIRQMLSAFDYTHKLGIVHRDIKPANVFLTDEGEVKIADFGIARIENSNLTQAGSVLGTPNYMSPEQCTGQSMDHRSDLFSIGIVFYELLTGEKPFNGNSMHAVMHKIVSTEPEKPSDLNPAVPPALNQVIAKALAKSPTMRFQSADEFRKAIDVAMKGPAAAMDATIPLTGNQSSAAATVIIKQAPQLASPTSKVASAIIASLLAIAFAGSGYWFWQHKEGQQAVPGTSAISSPPSSSGDATNPASIPVPQEASTLTPAQQDKIQKLLKVAQISEQAGRFVWPPTSNAAFVYRTILQIDPNNETATKGLNAIADKLYSQAEEMLQGGDKEALKAHLELCREAFPNDERFVRIMQLAKSAP